MFLCFVAHTNRPENQPEIDKSLQFHLARDDGVESGCRWLWFFFRLSPHHSPVCGESWCWSRKRREMGLIFECEFWSLAGRDGFGKLQSNKETGRRGKTWGKKERKNDPSWSHLQTGWRGSITNRLDWVQKVAIDADDDQQMIVELIPVPVIAGCAMLYRERISLIRALKRRVSLHGPWTYGIWVLAEAALNEKQWGFFFSFLFVLKSEWKSRSFRSINKNCRSDKVVWKLPCRRMKRAFRPQMAYGFHFIYSCCLDAKHSFGPMSCWIRRSLQRGK